MQPPDERLGDRGDMDVDDVDVDGVDHVDAIVIDLTELEAAEERLADTDPQVDAAGVAADIDETAERETHAHAPRTIDPRIRARRIAVAREQGRRRLRVVLVALTLIVVIGSAWLVVHSPFLDVDHIVVSGIPSERVAAVIAASGVHRRDPLLLVSTGAVERRVDQVAGIGSVRVSREFPGTLHISAREQGVALWARVPGGGVALIGFDGRVQTIAPSVPRNVSELRGLAKVPAAGKTIPDVTIVNVMAQLPPDFRTRVGAISAATRSDVRLYLVAGGEVRLGDLSSLHDKAVVAESVIERMGCAIAYVDVQSITNPVARPAPGANCNG